MTREVIHVSRTGRRFSVLGEDLKSWAVVDPSMPRTDRGVFFLPKTEYIPVDVTGDTSTGKEG